MLLLFDSGAGLFGKRGFQLGIRLHSKLLLAKALGAKPFLARIIDFILSLLVGEIAADHECDGEKWTHIGLSYNSPSYCRRAMEC